MGLAGQLVVCCTERWEVLDVGKKRGMVIRVELHCCQ